MWILLEYIRKYQKLILILTLPIFVAGCESGVRLAEYAAALNKQNPTSRYASIRQRHDLALPVEVVAKAHKPRRTRRAKTPVPPVRTPLKQDEIEQALIGNSIYAGASGVEFAALHRPGGALAGRTWTDEGSENGRGSWKVEKDGLYCRKWDNSWSDGRWGCFKVFRNGSELVMQRVAGTGADSALVVMPGNAYGL